MFRAWYSFSLDRREQVFDLFYQGPARKKEKGAGWWRPIDQFRGDLLEAVYGPAGYEVSLGNGARLESVDYYARRLWIGYSSQGLT